MQDRLNPWILSPCLLLSQEHNILLFVAVLIQVVKQKLRHFQVDSLTAPTKCKGLCPFSHHKFKHRVTIPCKWSFIGFSWKVVLFSEKHCAFYEKHLKTYKKPLIQHRSLILTWSFIEYSRKATRYITFWWYLVVHVCVYGACMHTYVSSFVLHDFIMDFMKSNTILLKPKWFHDISNDFMKSNWILQRCNKIS